MAPRIRALVLIPLMTATTAGAARISIPMGPVPITFQTLAVLLSGALLGPRGGAAAMGLYLLLGLAGLPLFSSGGGPQYVLSPTFGFLLSFPLAAGAVGLAAGRPFGPGGFDLPPPGADCGKEPGKGRLALALLAGTAVIYAGGVPVLWWNLSQIQGKTLSLVQVLMAGMIPFLPGDLAKGALAFLVIPPLRRALEGKKGRMGVGNQ